MAEDQPLYEPCDRPAGGWGAAAATANGLNQERIVISTDGVVRQVVPRENSAALSLVWVAP